jgi:hypothetical protein
MIDPPLQWVEQQARDPSFRAWASEIPECEDRRLPAAIQAMMRVHAPQAGTEPLGLEVCELPVFGTENFDELPGDHTEGTPGQITRVAISRLAKAVLEVADAWPR